MGIFNKKNDYFVTIITGIAELKKDSDYHKEKLNRFEGDFKEYIKASHEIRKIDRMWQKDVNEKIGRYPKNQEIDKQDKRIDALENIRFSNKRILLFVVGVLSLLGSIAVILRFSFKLI